MKSDFMLAINQLCAERKLSHEVVMEAVEAAMISAYKRNFGATANIEAKIDPNTGDVGMFVVMDVVEEVQDQKTQITLEDARLMEPEVELEGTVLIESTPRDFGRIAAQTAKQVILQRIREAEREVLYSSYADRTGEIATGSIQSLDYHSGDAVIALEGGAEALLPSREQVPAEGYRRGSRLRAYVLDVRRGNRGPQITLSRRASAFLRRLMELEVPEVHNGAVEIKAIAREAGSRSKVAVYATQDGVDPVGSCVGVRGGRIQNVVNELGGEKIDVVQWDPEISKFIANSLSPAKVMNVLLDDHLESGKTGTVIVPDRQLSLAIGKEGQNARLAAKLTGWRIDIKSASEAAEETLGRLEDIEVAPEDMDLLSLAEAMLRRGDTDELTEEAQAQLAAGLEDGLQWPDEEPTVEEAAKAEAEAQKAAAEAVEADAAPAEEGAIAEAAAEAEPLVEGAEAGEALPEDADWVPPFDGEPIEDSLGWVATESQEDLYGGWEGVDAKDAGESLIPELDSDALWERDELPPEPQTKTKKKKKKSRSGYSAGKSSNINQRGRW